MDLRISPLTTAATARLPSAPKLNSAQGPDGQDAGFTGALKGALKSVSASQNQSAALQREVQMENPSVSLEETMVAIQKAQIGFQATLHVRNRMVQAYTDIMNMQV